VVGKRAQELSLEVTRNFFSHGTNQVPSEGTRSRMHCRDLALFLSSPFLLSFLASYLPFLSSFPDTSTQTNPQPSSASSVILVFVLFVFSSSILLLLFLSRPFFSCCCWVI
jgi:hypothetical protein